MTDWEDYESGPFCRHWGDYYDCDRVCKCGHTCPKHLDDDDEECRECCCKGWKDAEG